MRSGSLALRLLWWLVSVFAITWGMLAWVTYQSARHEVEEVFDAQLAQYSRIIMGLTLHELEEEKDNDATGSSASMVPFSEEFTAELSGHEYEKKLVFQVLRHGELLIRSHSAPRERLGAAAGYSDQEVEGRWWRVFVLSRNRGEFQVHVGELHEVRGELVGEITAHALWPLLVALPILMVLIWLGVERGLSPLLNLAREVAKRSPRDLSRVDDGIVPREAVPLIEALNALLYRLERALDQERRFTSDAAHELRTPLAAVKVQAQVASRAQEAAERSRALNGILAGTDRATHIVEQLLTLARLDDDRIIARFVAVNLARVVEEAVALEAPLAVERGIDLELEVGESVGELPGNPAILAVLARNLVDNAIRYTPDGGKVVVSVAGQGRRLQMTVSDSGPGIPIDQRSAVLERFRRGKEKDAHGCGIGLSIVKRASELHHATLELGDSPLGGLEVRVGFAVPG